MRFFTTSQLVRFISVPTAVAILSSPASQAQVPGEKPTVCHGFYSHVPEGYHPNSRRSFDSFPFSIEVRAETVKIQWLDYSDAYIEKQPSVGAIVTGYDDWAFGNFRLLCGDRGSVVLVADRKGEGVQTLKLVRSKGDIFSVAEQRGWPMGE